MSGSTACEIADVLLLSLFTQGASTAMIEPQVRGNAQVIIERGNQVIARAILEADLAEAVVARLALLAGLDPVERAGQLGRSHVKSAGVAYEVLVTTRTAAAGPGCEVRLLDAVGDRAPGGRLARGSRIGPYKIIQVLGQGGMGVVYLVEHKQLQKRFAMKVLLQSVFEEDPESAARFVCEARAAARAHHPGIVNVSDFGSLADGRAFLVMELLSGESVGEIVAADGPFELRRALELVGEAAGALSAAHEAGVVHRDLTPSNMFVEVDKNDVERLVLVDFGAAKMTDAGVLGEEEGERAKVVFGTPYYMAPEHAQGRPCDGRSDIYALGCCLYEMLTGEVPYRAETVRKILLKHILEPLPSLEGSGADFPFTRGLLRRMLAKRPEDRYQTANELAAGVRACLDQLDAGAG